MQTTKTKKIKNCKPADENEQPRIRYRRTAKKKVFSFLSTVTKKNVSHQEIQHHSNDTDIQEASATCKRRNHHSFVQGCYYSSSSSCWSSDNILFLTPLHHELTDVLLEANLRHGYHSGVKEHTHVAFDLPPSQQIDTSLFVVYYHRWGNHLTLFDSRKSASDLPQEELCSEGIHRLDWRKPQITWFRCVKGKIGLDTFTCFAVFAFLSLKCHALTRCCLV